MEKKLKYIAAVDPYKEDAPVVIYEQMDEGYIIHYDKESTISKLIEMQEYYKQQAFEAMMIPLERLDSYEGVSPVYFYDILKNKVIKLESPQ